MQLLYSQNKSIIIYKLPETTVNIAQRSILLCVPETSLKEQRSSFTCVLNLGIDNDLGSRKSTGHEKVPNVLWAPNATQCGKMYRQEDQKDGDLVLRCPSWVHS